MSDFDFGGKRVIVRAGSDTPLDEEGNITDDKRIRISVPTVKKLLEKGAKQVILMCHLGRPKERSGKLSTRKVAERFSELLGEKIRHVDGWSVEGCENERIVFLENLRFNSGEKSKDEKEREAFGKQLASLADYYVNDAFNNCHREHASMYYVPQFIPGCVSENIEHEISSIKKALDNPERPLVSIIGGLKADKLNAVKNLLGKADRILIGGALAFTVLRALGKNVGKSRTDDEGLKGFSDVIDEIKKGGKVLLPADTVVAERPEEGAEAHVVPVNEIPENMMALDIGPETTELYKKELSKAKTIVWNGPIGVFEVEKFAKGTREIAQHIAGLEAAKIIGGGDSAAAIAKLGLEDRMTLVSTGGGASLKLIEGAGLAAVKALEESHKKFSH
jgi:phosphoglycerate kinase